MHMASPDSLVIWLTFLVGRRDSIRAIAGSARAWWFGVGLVFLTSIARNYDQTWIGEAPVKWLVGNAGFSLVSGTLLFLCLRGFLRGRIPDPRVGFGTSWLQFMGLFWATAPVAWWYAIPVERFLGSLDAAYANVALLALVSLWRVLLMARVISVLHSVPYGCALAWTLTAACIEVAVVGFVGASNGISRRILAGMGGLRNSPEEDVMLAALSRAVEGSVLLFLPALIAAFALRGSRKFSADIVPRPGRLPWGGFAVVAGFWLIVALPAQRETRLNAQLDSLVTTSRFRKALDHLSTNGPNAYAPSRGLAPKVYELSVFDELPGMLGVLASNDPPWLHAHLLQRWESTCRHFGYTPSTQGPHPSVDGSNMQFGQELLLGRLSTAAWQDVIQGLEQSAPGRRWLTNNAAIFWVGYHSAEKMDRERDWAELSDRLKKYPEPKATETK